LSRPKKNIARDFSDGVLVAEIIAYYLPQGIDVLSIDYRKLFILL